MPRRWLRRRLCVCCWRWSGRNLLCRHHRRACAKCGGKADHYRNGTYTCLCQECHDAPAVTERKFVGATTYRLCEGCAAYWDEHELDKEVDLSSAFTDEMGKTL